MNAYIFPGQGAQFVGMGLDLYENHSVAQQLFEQANEINKKRVQASLDRAQKRLNDKSQNLERPSNRS